MEENSEQVVIKEVYRGDVRALATQFKEHESCLNLKRRWLMDLPLKDAEEKRVEEMLSADRIIPESFLRKDDVSYENIKTSIEMGFGVHKHEQELFSVEEEVHIFMSPDDYRDLFLLLDGMTNKGLCSFANILTEGLVKFEKTNVIMRRMIKEHLRKFIRNKNDTSEIKLKQLLQLVRDPRNFQESPPGVPTICEAYYDAAMKVLDGLEDFSSITLHAMKRKLKGVRGFIPCTKPTRCGLTRDKLIGRLRKQCKKMLLDPGKGGEPAEQVASALGVASLALEHLLNRPVAVNFRIFSSEVKALQSDVAKAIWMLNQPKRVSVTELPVLAALLDPNVKLKVRSLRNRVCYMLTEYLFECADMEEVPDNLIKTLDIINGKFLPFHKKYSTTKTQLPQFSVKEEMETEVEHVLAVSAQAKEVLLNLFRGHEFDQDFAEAYMEDIEEGDMPFAFADVELNGNVQRLCEFDDLQSQTSSIGDTYPDIFSSHVSTSEADNSHVRSDGTLNTPSESTHVKELDLDVTSGSYHTHSVEESETKIGQHVDTEQNSSRVTVKMEEVDPSDATCTKRLSPYFAGTTDKSNCKKEETVGFSTATPKSEAPDFSSERRHVDCHQNTSCNTYLEIQEACDATSMVAYKFVGRMLDELAKVEGIELYRGDRLYLRSGASITQDSEESTESLLTSRFSEMWKAVLET